MSDLEQARKDPKFIASAVLVALIVIAGIVLVGVKAFGGDKNDAGGAPAGTSTSTVSPGGSSSVCGLPNGDQAIPTVAPKTAWYIKGKVATPRSVEFGPAKGKADVASCFARNPEGALFAVATLAADIYPRDERTKRALELRAVPGLDLDATLKDDLGTPGPISQFAGFRFEDYTPDRATITLATRLTDGPNAGSLGATPLTVVWRNGDWYLQLQETSQSIVLSSLDGFVKWSGVS